MDSSSSPPPPPPPQGQGPPPGAIPIQFPPGVRPTPEQIQEIQRRITEDAEKAGMSVPDFIEMIKAQQARMRAAQQAQAQAQQQGGQLPMGPPGEHDHSHPHQHPHPHPPPGAQQGRPQPIVPGPPNPAALALAKFLRGQELKPRTCILNGQRKDMFKGLYPLDSLTMFDADSKLLVQSSELSALCNRPPTKRPARRTLYSPRSLTAPRSKTPSSCFP
jgi:hypothetical protein